MARRAPLNCSTQPLIKATTDIAGPGVLYSYLISALLAIIAIVLGYLSDSLPDQDLNETDETVIASFQAWLPSAENAARMRRWWHKLKTVALLGKKAKPHVILTKRQRQELVKRFILTLSDQQLATGLAILIAATANQRTLTVWEFQLAFSLAWFSSTTHLATLDCLREYFLEHGAVRNWRVVGMLALLIMLMYSLIMSMASVDATIPVQCTFGYFGDRGEYDATPLNINDILSAGLTLVLLTWQYLVRIMWSYKLNEDGPTNTERMVFNLRTRSYRKKIKPSPEELQYVIEQAILERDSMHRRKELERIRISSGVRRHYLIAWRASNIYSESFLSLGPMLSFMISFGFSQLYLNRWHSKVPIEIDTSMSFGQITPLFLLVLPILAAAEAYYEVQDAPSHIKVDKELQRDREPSKSRHRQSSSDTWPLQITAGRAYSAPDMYDLQPVQDEQALHEYEQLLEPMKRYFYQEIKAIAVQDEANDTKKGGLTSTLRLKGHLVTSYHVLSAQEHALKVTTLTSLVEFTICVTVSIALGILVYIEGSSQWSTIASYVLFCLCLAYKGFGWIAYLVASKVNIKETDYRRLVLEAQERLTGEAVQDPTMVDHR